MQLDLIVSHKDSICCREINVEQDLVSNQRESVLVCHTGTDHRRLTLGVGMFMFGF